MVRGQTTLSTPRSVGRLAGNRHTESSRGLVARTAAHDRAAACLTLDLVNVRDRSAVATGVFVFFALGANAAAAGVKRSHDVDAFAASRTAEHVATLVPRAGAHRSGGQDGLSSLGRLGTARGRARVAGHADTASRAVVAARVGVARARFARLAIGGRDRTTRADYASGRAGIGNSPGGTIRALVVILVAAGLALGTFSVAVNLARCALVDALIAIGGASATALATWALHARAGTSRRVGIFRTIGARCSALQRVRPGGAGLTVAAGQIFTGLTRARALRRPG